MTSLWTLRDSVRYVRSCHPLPNRPPSPRLDNLDPLHLSARLLPEISELCLLSEERNSDQNPQQILVLMCFWSPLHRGADEGFRYATVPSIFGGRRHLRRQDVTHHVAREPVNVGGVEEISFICECQVREHTYKVKTMALPQPSVELLLLFIISSLSLSSINIRQSYTIFIPTPAQQ